MRGGMDELQVLRDEFEIDQAAGDVFQIPAVGVALLDRDRAAHLDHVAGDLLRRRAGCAGRRGSPPRPARAKSGDADDHARARQRHVLPGPGFGLADSSRTTPSDVATGPERPDGRSRMSTS